MRKLALQEFVTLDGVMEAPEKWTGAFWSDELQAYARDRLFEADALVLGRVTYEVFASSWPSRSGDDFSDRINSMPKYVASRTLTNPKWNAAVIDGDVVEEVARLKDQPGGDLLVYASGQLVDTLMDHDLIDDYRIWVFPIVFGGGKRLFDRHDSKALDLMDTTTFDTGVVILSYAPPAPPKM